MRKDCEAVVYGDNEKAIKDGILFYRSTNDVIVTEGINGTLQPKYIKDVYALGQMKRISSGGQQFAHGRRINKDTLEKDFFYAFSFVQNDNMTREVCYERENDDTMTG